MGKAVNDGWKLRIYGVVVKMRHLSTVTIYVLNWLIYMDGSKSRSIKLITAYD